CIAMPQCELRFRNAVDDRTADVLQVFATQVLIEPTKLIHILLGRCLVRVLLATTDALELVTKRLAARDRFVMLPVDTDARAVHSLRDRDDYRLFASQPRQLRGRTGPLASRRFCGQPFDAEFYVEAAEVRRMIELSGMIGLQCGVLEDV